MMNSKDSTTLEAIAFVVPPHLIEVFEKAQAELKEFYGTSPAINELIRFWIACATSRAIRNEFEEAVIATQKRPTETDLKDIHDDY